MKTLIEELREKVRDILYELSIDTDCLNDVKDGFEDPVIMSLIDLFGKGTYNKIKEISYLENKKKLIESELKNKLNEVDSEITRLKNLGEAEQKASMAFGKDIKLK